jgi:hypothetical protein
MAGSGGRWILSVAAIYAATLFWLPADGFWVPDNGNKWIQVQTLIESGHRNYAIPWPGRELDPDFDRNPLANHFSVVHEGELYSVFSPVFPALAAPWVELLGSRSVYLLPFVAGVLLLVGVARMASALGLLASGRRDAVLLAGLCSPLWFYTVCFWEHIVAAALAVWAVARMLEFLEGAGAGALWSSGLLVAAAAWFRDQLLVLAAVMATVVFMEAVGTRLRSALVFSASVVVGLVPLALFQAWALGDPVGFHLTHGFHVGPESGLVERAMKHMLERPRVLFHLFAASTPGIVSSVLLTLPFGVAVLLHPKLSGRGFAIGVVFTAGWSVLVSGVMWMGRATAASPIQWLLVTNGLFAAAPWCLLAGLRCRDTDVDTPEWRGRRRLWLLVASYAVAYGLLSPLRNAVGIHWGNRYLLVLYPFLAVGAAATLHDLQRSRVAWARWAAAAVLVGAVASAGLQLLALDLLQRKKDFTRRLEAAVRERPEQVVVTPHWWVPQTLSGVFFERKIFHVEDDADRRRFEAILRGHGVERYLLVLSGLEREPGIADVVVDDNGLAFFTQHLVPRRLQP